MHLGCPGRYLLLGQLPPQLPAPLPQSVVPQGPGVPGPPSAAPVSSVTAAAAAWIEHGADAASTGLPVLAELLAQDLSVSPTPATRCCSEIQKSVAVNLKRPVWISVGRKPTGENLPIQC